MNDYSGWKLAYRLLPIDVDCKDIMDAQKLKIAAAAKALEFVKEGMKLGIGTGSTANEFIRLLGAKVADGFNIVGIPTSIASADLCRSLSIPLATLDEEPILDLTIDGADEIGPKMGLIKGGGGALLREKIVACASHDMIVIADESKLVSELGDFGVPIEVNSFGVGATKLAIEKVAADYGLRLDIRLRQRDNKNFMTDGGHYILDAFFGRISKPKSLSDALFAIPGVVEHGLFLDIASHAVIARKDGNIDVLSVSDLV